MFDFSPFNKLTPWRNGNASDSRPEDWGFDSLWGQIFGVEPNNKGRIAQSVERWSNKPLVMGSIPIVPILFFWASFFFFFFSFLWMVKICVARELNPDLLLGRQQC